MVGLAPAALAASMAIAMMVAPSAGNVTLVSGELGDAAQQRAGLDDALDDGEDARLRLLVSRWQRSNLQQNARRRATSS